MIVLFFINPIAAAFAVSGTDRCGCIQRRNGSTWRWCNSCWRLALLEYCSLVGGALLFGGGAGAGIGTLAASSSAIVLTELAKMEVVLKEIILGIQRDTQMMQEIIMSMNDNLNEMRKEVIILKMENEKNKNKIKNLEESIEYLKKAIDEFQNMK